MGFAADRSLRASKLLKLAYKLGVLKPYAAIDRMRYLKRLAKGGRAGDHRYASPHDVQQYEDGSVLILDRFLNTDVLFHCDPLHDYEKWIIREGFASRVLRLMAALAEDGSIAIDVGANVGAYVVPLAKARPMVEWHAIEPNPDAVARLRRNVMTNRLNDIRLHEQAAGSAPARLPLHVFGLKDIGLSSFLPPREAVDGAKTIQVDVVTLDSLFAASAKPISLIKIDVEGYEWEVLQGAMQLIHLHHPAIVFEHFDERFASNADRAAAKERLRAFFSSLGYAVHFITRYGPDLLLPIHWGRPIHGDLVALQHP